MMRPACRRELKERGAYYSRWVLGIQRRTVYLVPPSLADLEWMFEQFRNPDIWVKRQGKWLIDDFLIPDWRWP